MITRHVRAASAVAGLLLSLFVAAPAAHADPVADIRGTVTRDRINSGCPEMKYNQTLQDLAFAQADYIPAPPATINGLKASFNGEVRVYRGDGDPMADALTKAYQNGGGPTIGDCSFTEYGVSFRRNEAYDPEDIVGLVFGKPNAAPPVTPNEPQKPKPDPVENPVPVPVAVPVKCPTGSPKAEVPAGQTCPDPANAITVSFKKPILGNWTVTVKNSAGIGGSCTYDATPAGFGLSVHEDFDIGPNASHDFSVLNPGALKYNTETVCTGTYDGRQVELGRVKQGV